jgi:hypothetical protein
MNVAATHARRHRISGILRREFSELAIISVYLYVWFGALLLFKTAALRAHGIGYAPYGFAAIKALVLGKFILLGNDLHIDARLTGMPLIRFLAYKVLIFTAFLFLLSFLEEIAIAFLHGRPATEAFSDFGTWLHITWSFILICLILIRFLFLKATSDSIGAGMFRRIFFGK